MYWLEATLCVRQMHEGDGCSLLHENGQLGKLKKKIIQQAKHFHPVFNVNKLSQVVSELQANSQYLQAEWHTRRPLLAQTQVLMKLTIPAIQFPGYIAGVNAGLQGAGKQAGLPGRGWAMCIGTNIPEQMDGS